MVPDAPWIRYKERNGEDPPPEVHCPWCGDDCETLYIDSNGDVAGCEHCIERVDAYDWAQAHREERDDDYYPGED